MDVSDVIAWLSDNMRMDIDANGGYSPNRFTKEALNFLLLNGFRLSYVTATKNYVVVPPFVDNVVNVDTGGSDAFQPVDSPRSVAVVDDTATVIDDDKTFSLVSAHNNTGGTLELRLGNQAKDEVYLTVNIVAGAWLPVNDNIRNVHFVNRLFAGDSVYGWWSGANAGGVVIVQDWE